MRLGAFLLLPLLVAAEQQPLKEKAAGWFDKAKSYIPSAVPSPVDAGAAKVAEKVVERINIRNWRRKLSPKLEGEEDWMVLFTGGNKSCYGKCGPAVEAWNLAAAPITALPSSPRLGVVDCEKEDKLCTAFGAACPTLWYFKFPQKPATNSISTPKTPLYIIDVNTTTVTPQDFVKIAADKTYLENPEYTGPFHPIDGWLEQYGLLIPVGYLLWGFGSTPSWLVMIGISFFSRQFMAKRMQTRGTQPTSGMTAAPPAAAAPPPRAAGGAGKKRK